jgi:hypothetical protein
MSVMQYRTMQWIQCNCNVCNPMSMQCQTLQRIGCNCDISLFVQKTVSNNIVIFYEKIQCIAIRYCSMFFWFKKST